MHFVNLSGNSKSTSDCRNYVRCYVGMHVVMTVRNLTGSEVTASSASVPQLSVYCSHFVLIFAQRKHCFSKSKASLRETDTAKAYEGGMDYFTWASWMGYFQQLWVSLWR